MLDEARLGRFMSGLAESATGPGRVYLAGGASAVLLNIRSQTIDVDIKLDPEPAGAFEAIAHLKEDLSINVELAAPDQFLPALPQWQDRSEFIVRHRQVDFYHYDFYSQALSKILRGHRFDLDDARALVSLGKVLPGRLLELFDQIKPDLIRYPAIDPGEFERRLTDFVEGQND